MSYKTRDQRIADEVTAPIGYTEDQMCVVAGCRSRWSLISSKLCSAHHWASADDFDDVTEASKHRARIPEPRPHEHYTQAEKREILHKMRELIHGGQPEPKAWAYALKAQEDLGEPLTLAQRDMWRAALKWVNVEGARREEEVW